MTFLKIVFLHYPHARHGNNYSYHNTFAAADITSHAYPIECSGNRVSLQYRRTSPQKISLYHAQKTSKCPDFPLAPAFEKYCKADLQAKCIGLWWRVNGSAVMITG